MEKTIIDTMRCKHPLAFYSCWVAIAMWGILSILNNFGEGDFQILIDEFGLIAFMAMFITIPISFGSALRHKQFICNVYDSIRNNWAKIIVGGMSIIFLSIILIMGVVSLREIFETNHSAFDISIIFDEIKNSLILFVTFVVIFFITYCAKYVVRCFMENYSGRIIILGTDIILMANLYFFIVFCGALIAYSFIIRVFVMLLVGRFLYDLYKIARIDRCSK